ncbi:MAG: 16S rRNA (adenine(1518)-N(6)/adenine(1519)-N(6))-dimethyltransferase RsmA, partial [Halobacteriota archaeon]|nr:16S rRNA (adenine(1518)-N(6)/adenine(1519)-N(6))-dimethyltransferase RsmA [Halobacteriota archaeon]
GYADITSSDVVLEIGAGSGKLTEKLEKMAGKVYAIEKDRSLCNVLEGKCRSTEVICGDVLTIDLPRFDKVVANLPYSISSGITFKLFDYDFKIGILMYQHEFAERMIAKPNTREYSRLSVSTQYFSDVRILEVVPRTAFHPRPRVKSAIVRITPREPPYDIHDMEFFFDFVTAVFTQRRKKMRNAILNTAQISRIDDVKRVVSSLPEEMMDKRPEELLPEELAGLSNIIVSTGLLR